MPPSADRILPPLLATLLCLAGGVLFTTPVTDGDFFWHLQTGRWIWEHRALPATDPFTYTTTVLNADPGRLAFLLRQYWLGQLLLAGVWQLAGAAGIVLVRAASYTVILAFLWRWLRRRQAGVLALLPLLLAAATLRFFPNERPQLVTFLAFPLLLWLLERLRERATQPDRTTALGLPLLMLVWANCHGGYLLGVLVLLLYLGCLLWERRQALPGAGRSLAILLAAVGASALNPAGLRGVAELLSPLSAHSASIYELLPPLTVFRQTGVVFWPWLATLLLIAAVLARRWRQLPLAPALTLLAMALLSLTALRYLIFPALALPLLAGQLPELRWDGKNSLLAAAVLVAWLAGAAGGGAWRFAIGDQFPQQAAAFLRQTPLPPRLFNYADWGGYLNLTLPGVRTFTDGRGLVPAVSLEHDAVLQGEGDAILARYGINTLVFPGVTAVPGTPLPLVRQLLANPAWQPVYADDVALVFVRTEMLAPTGVAPLPRQAVYRHLATAAERLLRQDANNPALWRTRADALQLLGERDAARNAYQRLLRLDPGDTWARQMLAMP